MEIKTIIKKEKISTKSIRSINSRKDLKIIKKIKKATKKIIKIIKKGISSTIKIIIKIYYSSLVNHLSLIITSQAIISISHKNIQQIKSYIKKLKHLYPTITHNKLLEQTNPQQ